MGSNIIENNCAAGADKPIHQTLIEKIHMVDRMGANVLLDAWAYDQEWETIVLKILRPGAINCESFKSSIVGEKKHCNY